MSALHPDDAAYMTILERAFDLEEISQHIEDTRFDFLFYTVEDLL